MSCNQLTKTNKLHIISSTEYRKEMWEKSLVHSPFGVNDRLIFLVCRFFSLMGNLQRKKHNIALIMLSATAFIWGSGFLLSDTLLKNGFANIPFSLNALRFGIAAIVLSIVFCKRITLSKQLMLYGCVGGVLLFGGFGMQLLGLRYTTPATCGFFTASYTLFVPLIVWIIYKKRPPLLASLGIVAALAGLLVLNVPNQEGPQVENELLGNLLTLGGSLFFAIQIIWAERALKDKGVDPVGMTVVQVATCATVFIVVAFIFEANKYGTEQIDWKVCWWILAIISLLGTAFAYFSQTFGQNYLTSTETSIVIACESPIGAIMSVAIGAERLSWQICVGGFLILLAVVLVEILPNALSKNTETTSECEKSEKEEDSDIKRQE